MSTPNQNQSNQKPMNKTWNIAIFSGIPLVSAGAAAAFTYAASKGDVATTVQTAKFIGISIGSALTALEGLACFCAGFREYEYSHFGEGDFYPVRKTEEQELALKNAWIGVAVSAVALTAAGYLIPSKPLENEPQKETTPHKTTTKEVAPKKDTYHTSNGYTLHLA